MADLSTEGTKGHKGTRPLLSPAVKAGGLTGDTSGDTACGPSRSVPDTTDPISAPLQSPKVKRLRRGRPPLSGPRYQCGQLKTENARTSQPGLSSLTFVQGEALRRFSKDTERSEATRDADKRLDARQSLAAATAAMSQRERAVVDLLLIKGRNIRDLATAASTTVEDLDRLLHQAADTLAAHYQSREAA